MSPNLSSPNFGPWRHCTYGHDAAYVSIVKCEVSWYFNRTSIRMKIDYFAVALHLKIYSKTGCSSLSPPQYFSVETGSSIQRIFQMHERGIRFIFITKSIHMGRRLTSGVVLNRLYSDIILFNFRILIVMTGIATICLLWISMIDAKCHKRFPLCLIGTNSFHWS